jgi:hypothetical protein
VKQCLEGNGIKKGEGVKRRNRMAIIKKQDEKRRKSE